MLSRLQARTLTIFLAFGLFACQEAATDGKSFARKPASANAEKPEASAKSKDSVKKPTETEGDEDELEDTVDEVPKPEIKPIETEMPPTETAPIPKPIEMDNKSAGCLAAEQLAEGTKEFTQGQFKRKYIVHKPASYKPDRAWPVVLALHPNGGNTSYWSGTSGDRAIRKLFGDKVIIVIAQAREGDWRGDLPTELAYFDTLLKSVKSNLCVDTQRIFSMGFSGGGSFSGVLGCMRNDIRAFASGGGVAYYDEKNCIGKSSAWITIGDKESNEGRTSYRDFWRSYNSCTAESVKGKPDTCQEYSCSDKGRVTVFCSHAGDHVWPAFGSQAAWDFFSRY